MTTLTTIESTNTEHIRKYPKVPRYGKKGTRFEEGDHIVIFEKLDGANASFTREGDKLVAYSRNRKLDASETLRGFYGFVQSLPVEEFEEGLIYYGEWLVRHQLDYGENEGKFYLFDIYDNSVDGWGGFIEYLYVMLESHTLGLTMAPKFYSGPYISEEHIKSFVGKSKLGERGEGVVVKAYRKNPQMIVKYVSQEFSEFMGVRPQKEKNKSVVMQFVEQTVTRARVEKILLKEFPPTIQLEDMGRVLKVMGPAVTQDIIEEESDLMEAEFGEKELRGCVSRVIAPIIKKIILERTN